MDDRELLVRSSGFYNMDIRRSIGARMIGFSHMDNLLTSLSNYIRELSSDGGLVLDDGCGKMHISSYISNILGHEYDVVASDINPKKIHNPSDKYSSQSSLHPIVSDATNLPFQPNIFDVVYSTSFFSHVHSHDTALKEQIRVAKPGGYIIIIDENLFSPYQLYKWITSGGMDWIKNQNETKELEVKGFKFKGKNENHYSPKYWRDYINSHKNLRLNTISSPRVEEDKALSEIFNSSIISKLYTCYETHTIVVAKVTK